MLVKFEQTFKTKGKNTEKKHRTHPQHISVLPNGPKQLLVPATQHTSRFSFPSGHWTNQRFPVWDKKTPTPGCVASQSKSRFETTITCKPITVLENSDAQVRHKIVIGTGHMTSPAISNYMSESHTWLNRYLILTLGHVCVDSHLWILIG